MKNTLKALSLISILALASACSPQETVTESKVEKETPTVGQVITDSISGNPVKEEPTTEKSEETESAFEELEVPKEPAGELEVPEDKGDVLHSVAIMEQCDKLVSTITKNIPKSKEPFNITSSYKRLPEGNSVVTVGFEAITLAGDRTQFIGDCEFDKEGNLISFSADPIPSVKGN